MQPVTDKISFWQDHITAWQKSGQSQTDYCRGHELKLSTFTYWRGKHARRINKFVPLMVASPTSAVTVSLPGGVRIDLPAGQLEAALPLVLRLVREQA